MTFRVVRSPRATEEILAIASGLAAYSLPSARRFLEHLRQAQQQLSTLPYSGARGLLPDTRRLVLGDCLIAYRVRGQTVEIFAVRHAKRGDARL
jgi:plasmid stabilization system protein ParE